MTLEIIAITISFISLGVALYQSYSLKRSIDNQIYSSCITNSLEIDRLLIERPELRKYIYYGEEIRDDTPDLERIMSIEEFIVDAVENIEVYHRYIPKDRRDGWLKFARDMKQTPAYKYYINNHDKMHGEWFEVKK